MESNTTLVHIGAPIALLLISLMTYIFVSLEIKKKRLEIKDIVVWIVTNTVYTICILYILIVEIIKYYSIDKQVLNIFSWIAYHAFGIKFEGQEWILMLIFAFISFIIIQVMVIAVRTQKMKKRIDDLNKEVAILSGKVNKTAEISATKIAFNIKTSADVKKDLREQIRIARAEKRAKQKLRILTQTTSIKLPPRSKSNSKEKVKTEDNK